jgi:hypothetical protein
VQFFAGDVGNIAALANELNERRLIVRRAIFQLPCPRYVFLSLDTVDGASPQVLPASGDCAISNIFDDFRFELSTCLR